MADNFTLGQGKVAKEDEFYTRREDIEQELSFYMQHFADKSVYCNCDDPKQSEFWKFFVRNFDVLRLKRLVATHYDPNERNYTYKLVMDDGHTQSDDVVEQPIMCNGDFRSQICIDLLEEADIVVTNPPVFAISRIYRTAYGA